MAFGGMRDDLKFLGFASFLVADDDQFAGLHGAASFGEEFPDTVLFAKEEAFPSSTRLLAVTDESSWDDS